MSLSLRPSEERVVHRAPHAADRINRNLATAARYWRVKPRDVLGLDRSRFLARPRHVAMFLSRLDGFSRLEIARHFRRTRDSVVYAERVVERLMATNARFAADVRAVAGILGLDMPVRGPLDAKEPAPPRTGWAGSDA
jgi:chromosomal replication initiation ATPase DnaA